MGCSGKTGSVLCSSGNVKEALRPTRLLAALRYRRSESYRAWRQRQMQSVTIKESEQSCPSILPPFTRLLFLIFSFYNRHDRVKARNARLFGADLTQDPGSRRFDLDINFIRLNFE